MLIQLEHVNKNYGEQENLVQALHDICLEIERGELISLIGKSGSGKSTLLHLLGAVDSPSEGTIIYDGVQLNTRSEKELAQYRRQQVGFVFQDFKLLPELTVSENITVPFVLDRRKIDWDKVNQIIEKLGLSDKKDNYPEELSGGQKQRVAIGRAIVHGPGLLLCDEPTGALDSVTTKEILDLLKSLHDDGMTIIIATHDSQVSAACNRTIQLNDGKII